MRPTAAGGWFAGIAIVVTLAVLAPGMAAAASCTGNAHEMTLSNGTGSPGSGTPATDFTFTVVYTDSAGCAPDEIVVRIPGLGAFPLAHRKGDLSAGATFGRDMTLPGGNWDYRFEATSGSGPGLRTATFTKVDPGVIRVVDPTPRPTREPDPTEKPPPPTPKPHGTSGPTHAPPTPRATDAPPTDGPAKSDRPEPTDEGKPRPGAGASLSGGPGRGRPGSDAGGGPGAVNQAGGPTAAGPPLPLASLFVSLAGSVVGLVLFWLLGARLLGTTGRRPAERGGVDQGRGAP